MHTAVVNHDLPIAEALEGRHEDLSVVKVSGVEETVSALFEAEILVCNGTRWDEQFLEGLESGNWLQPTSAGYDAFPVDELADRGVRLSNASGVHNPVVAEHAFALAFAFSRMVPEFSAKQNRTEWGPRDEISSELTDWKNHTLTVFGLGSIGEDIAVRGLAFEMDVYGIKRDPDDYNGGLDPDRVLGTEAFHDVLPETDLLVIVVPLTDETRNTIDTDVFRALPDSAIVINIARGEVVDEGDLLDALEDDEISSAGLDVFEAEPLPVESPLWERDDVLVTPHVAGRSNTFPDRFADLFFDNYERWRTDSELINRVV